MFGRKRWNLSTQACLIKEMLQISNEQLTAKKFRYVKYIASVGPVGLNKLVVSSAEWALGGNVCIKGLLFTKDSELWLSLAGLVDSNALLILTSLFQKLISLHTSK